MLRQTIIFVLVGFLSAHFIASANALKCVHCRLDICTHEYCSQTKQLFNSSAETGAYVEIENWANIPECPQKPEDRNKTELLQTCSTEGASCGLFNYNVTTKNTPSISPGNQSSVLVVGGGSQSYESSVVVLGCVKPNYKCRTGLTQITNVQVALARNSTSSTLGESKINHIESINSESNCCKCESDFCNKNKDDVKDCSGNLIHVPQQDSTNEGGKLLFYSPFLVLTSIYLLI